jgi:RimJ/RimL family protein N-acetyltransferase
MENTNETEFPFKTPPNNGIFGGIGSGSTEKDLTKVQSSLRIDDPRELHNVVVDENDSSFSEGVQFSKDGLWNYSDRFVPYEETTTLDGESTFYLGQQRLEVMRKNIHEEQLGESIDEFEVIYKGELGKRRFKVIDIKGLPDEVFDYCVEEMYWAMHRKEVNKYLLYSTTEFDRAQRRAFLESIKSNDDNNYYFLFDVTDKSPRLVAHANMKKHILQGLDLESGEYEIGLAIYFPELFGSNKSELSDNSSIGNHMFELRIKLAREKGIKVLTAYIAEENIPSLRLIEKHGFVYAGQGVFQGPNGEEQIKKKYRLYL